MTMKTSFPPKKAAFTWWLVCSTILVTFPALAHPDLKGSTSTNPCPFQRRKTQEALEAANEDREARMAEWEAWENSPEANEGVEPLVPRQYEPGVANEGEEFCSGDDENMYCSKVRKRRSLA